MKLRYRLFLLFFVLGSIGFFTLAHSQDKFKLKPGAKGKLCVNCHVTFQEKIKSLFIHTPVKTGDCIGCHNPHASSHGKLLSADSAKVCYGCHSTMIPEKAKSSHKVVIDGNCSKCHDPHASKNKFNLLKAGNELCFDCHKEMGETIAKNKFKHSPVDGGCLNCHNPHASARANYLLRDPAPSLCLKCHKADSPSFVKQHMNYPVAGSDCSVCHNPHGSDKAGILFDNVHVPVSNKMCNQCHEDSASRNPLSTKKSGSDLCKGCHSNMINEVFGKNRLHWPLADKTGCLNCHNPHASAQKGLIKSKIVNLCGNCHKDTISRQGLSETKHPPISEGNCTVCHSPHSSDNISLMSQSSVIELCGTCHNWQKHSSHPIGEKAIDQRNKNLTLDCLSCHRSHGTKNKHFTHYEHETELCVQCHVGFRR